MGVSGHFAGEENVNKKVDVEMWEKLAIESAPARGQTIVKGQMRSALEATANFELEIRNFRDGESAGQELLTIEARRMPRRLIVGAIADFRFEMALLAYLRGERDTDNSEEPKALLSLALPTTADSGQAGRRRRASQRTPENLGREMECQ